MKKAVFISQNNLAYDPNTKAAFWMLRKTGFEVFTAGKYEEILQVAREQDIDLNQSWVIGNSLDEIEAGNRAGCGTVLIADGMETGWQVTMIRQPLMISNDLENAAGAVILRMIYNKVKTG